MKRSVLIMSAALIAASALAFAAFLSMTKAVSWSGDSDSLDELISGWASLAEIPGVIFHVQQGENVIYSGASGTLRKSGGPMVEPNTPFHTASVGKLFTATTVLRLHERGLLNINSPVANYLSSEIISGLVVVNDIDYSDQVTIRQLLTHRAGLGNTDQDLSFNIAVLARPARSWSPQELLNRARAVSSVGRPGQQVSYASPGYYLLGLLIEEISGLPYHQVVRQEVFEPLAMASTFETLHEWAGEEETLHHYAGWFDLSDHNPSFEFADGGFVTTAKDLAQFGVALAREELFTKSETSNEFLSLPDSLQDHERYQALGPIVDHSKSGTRLVYHAGFWGVLFIASPEEDAVAIVTLGQSASETWKFWADAKEYIADLF